MAEVPGTLPCSSPANEATCPVCLRRLKKVRLGKPENCDHKFCYTCIHEWSKNVNTCPVDRINFNYIEIYSSLHGELLDKVYVPDTNVIEQSFDPNDVTYCEICGNCDREDLLLLCDGCDKGFHLYCLSPALTEIPEGDWYCNTCIPIIFEQYNPSFVMDSDDSLSSDSEGNSSVNVVDSNSNSEEEIDVDDSDMELRPARNRNQTRYSTVMILESSQSSDEEEDSDDSSTNGGLNFPKQRSSSKFAILSSDEESVSDIDVVTMDCDRSNKDVSRLVVNEFQSDSGRARGESESESDDVPVGKRLKRSRICSQRVVSDSESIDESNLQPAMVSSAGGEKSESGNGVAWKNVTVPLTRLKWKIPRRQSCASVASNEDIERQEEAPTNNRVSVGENVDRTTHKNVECKVSERTSDTEPMCNGYIVLDEIDTTSLTNPAVQSKSRNKRKRRSGRNRKKNSRSSELKEEDTWIDSREYDAYWQKMRRSKRSFESSQREDTWTDYRMYDDALTCISPSRKRQELTKSKSGLLSPPSPSKPTYNDYKFARPPVNNWPADPANSFCFDGGSGGVSTYQDNPVNHLPRSLFGSPQLPVARHPLPAGTCNPRMCAAERSVSSIPSHSRERSFPQPQPLMNARSHAPPNFSESTEIKRFSSYRGPSVCSDEKREPFPPHPCPPSPLPALRNFSQSAGKEKFNSYYMHGPSTSTEVKSEQFSPSLRPPLPVRIKSELRAPTQVANGRSGSTQPVVPVTKRKRRKRKRSTVVLPVKTKTAVHKKKRPKRKRKRKIRLRVELQEGLPQCLTTSRRSDRFTCPQDANDPPYNCSPSKWQNQNDVANNLSERRSSRARTAATNTPRRQAMREAVRESYRHDNREEGLRFAQEILAKQGRIVRASPSRAANVPSDPLTTPTRRSSFVRATPQSGYVSHLSNQPYRTVEFVAETPPSTMSPRCRPHPKCESHSDVNVGPSHSQDYQELEDRVLQEVKERSVSSRRTLSSVLVTPLQQRERNCERRRDRKVEVESSDLIHQLCRSLDDLQNKNNIIKRDGSIIPIKSEIFDQSSHIPPDPLASLSSTMAVDSRMTSPRTPGVPVMTSSTLPGNSPKYSSPSRTCRRLFNTRSNDVSSARTEAQCALQQLRDARRDCSNHLRESSLVGNSCTDDDVMYVGSSPAVNALRFRADRDKESSRKVVDSDSEQCSSRNDSSSENSFIPETPIPSHSHSHSSTIPSLSTTSIAPTNQSTDITSSKSDTEDPKNYVKRLLKQHYHLGHISSYQFARILERATRKVEKGKAKQIDKRRIQKLVSDFVEAYTLTNPDQFA